MKRVLPLLLLVLFAACTKQTDGPTVALMEEVSMGAMPSKIGVFENGPYGQVSGNGQVFRVGEGSYEVVLDSFMSTNGPDLYVYLSKERMPVNFLEVGKLKSTNGRQVYPLAGNPDLSQYKYICIHCKAYNHLFGSALLK